MFKKILLDFENFLNKNNYNKLHYDLYEPITYYIYSLLSWYNKRFI